MCHLECLRRQGHCEYCIILHHRYVTRSELVSSRTHFSLLEPGLDTQPKEVASWDMISSPLLHQPQALLSDPALSSHCLIGTSRQGPALGFFGKEQP